MPSECRFTLYSETGLYFAAGYRIEGVVTLKTTNPKFIKQVKIRLKGVSKCGFSQTLPDRGEENCMPHSSIYFTSKEKLIKLETVVHEAGVLRAGAYCWPFSFFVHKNCPTSVEGASGHIRYELSLKIYNEAKYKNVFIKPLTIINSEDLNKKRIYRIPLRSEAHSTRLCGLFKTQTHFRIKTQFGGYTPGQPLVYTLEVFDKVVQEYRVRFVRRIEYRADKPATCTAVEEAILYHEFKPEDNQPYHTIVDAFNIPSTPPTMATKYISVEYFLRVSAKAPCCTKSKAELKIHIGTIPLKESLPPRYQRVLAKRSGNTFVIKPTGYQMPEIFDSPFIDPDEEELNRVEDFMPSYPMYTYRSYRRSREETLI